VAGLLIKRQGFIHDALIGDGVVSANYSVKMNVPAANARSWHPSALKVPSARWCLRLIALSA
jgi:hypothetical protein